MSSSQVSTKSPPDLVLFARGVISILAAWPALRLAVAQQWGGVESSAKRTWLASEVVDAFEAKGPQLDQWDIEEMLLQSMAEEFECNVEDGTSTTVARDVMKLWKELEGGRTEMLTKLESMAKSLEGKKVQAKVEEGNGDSDWEEDVDSDEMELDPSQSEDVAPPLINRSASTRMDIVPEVDEDGFTTVVKGRKPRQ